MLHHQSIVLMMATCKNIPDQQTNLWFCNSLLWLGFWFRCPATLQGELPESVVLGRAGLLYTLHHATPVRPACMVHQIGIARSASLVDSEVVDWVKLYLQMLLRP